MAEIPAKKTVAKKTTTAPAKKRTVLTPEQKIAKLEADLAAAREKAAAKNLATINALLEKRAKHTAKIKDSAAAITKLDEEIKAAGGAEQLAKVSGEVGLDPEDTDPIVGTDS